MTRKSICWAITLTGILATLVAVSGAWPGSNDGSNTNHQLEGSWIADVDIFDPPNLPPPIAPLKELFTFTSGGGVVETRRLYVPLPTPPDGPGPILETPGHGAWVKMGDHNFAITAVWLFQGAPDNPLTNGLLGTEKIRWNATLDHDQAGDELSGEGQAEVRDMNGNIVSTARARLHARRIQAEPLP